MNSNYKPAIIVVAFNREGPLKRLLSSLQKGIYPNNTKLIISIDKASNNQNILEAAKIFEWNFGEKEVIYQEENLGLKKHIIKCCDLVNIYGSVIILEDDLFVSKHFYDYTIKALNYYGEDETIAGVSLFKYPAIERRINPFPFISTIDNSDVHFIQFASSWGQAWTKEQWNSFKDWFNQKPDLESLWGTVPFTVLDWPLTSWKKFFISYMVTNNKFFVFPNQSLTTNFDDPGSNRFKITYTYQSPLKIDNNTDYKFIPFEKAQNKYDASFEILPEILKEYNQRLANYDFDVDLYGLKRPLELEKEYTLTTQKTSKAIFSFARSLKPHELNILFDIAGEDIFFTKKKDIEDISNKRYIAKYDIFFEKKISQLIKDYVYFYRSPDRIKDILKLAIHQFIEKIKRMLICRNKL